MNDMDGQSPSFTLADARTLVIDIYHSIQAELPLAEDLDHLAAELMKLRRALPV
jgi:hypothetical protein